MPQEAPLQSDMFTDELVDTRTRTQKRRDEAIDRPKQAEMFSTRELAQFGVTANPQLPLSPKTRLELSIDDPRTETEKEQDRMRAAEASTYGLFNHDPPSPQEPRIIKIFPSNLSFDMARVDEPDPQFALKLSDELDILLESTRDAAYERARDVSHLAGNEIYTVGDNQLEVWKPDQSGFFLVTYSDMDMVENIEWVEQERTSGEYVPQSSDAISPEPSDDHSNESGQMESPTETDRVGAAPKVEAAPSMSNTSSGEKVTPIYNQYDQIKQQFPGAIVFFRLGDFYETFSEDAEILARELDVVLTSRNISKTKRIPMSGVPYHAAESYIARLIAKGYHVAVCEQVGDEPVNGLMPREVVRVVTAGEESSALPTQEPVTPEPTTSRRPTWDEVRRRTNRTQTDNLPAKGDSNE